MRAHRYTDRTGARRHTLEVPIPAFAWRAALKMRAGRCPLEIAADQVTARRATGERFDYWAATEAPKT